MGTAREIRITVAALCRAGLAALWGLTIAVVLASTTGGGHRRLFYLGTALGLITLGASMRAAVSWRSKAIDVAFRCGYELGLGDRDDVVRPLSRV